jgi:hypothetical protein
MKSAQYFISNCGAMDRLLINIEDIVEINTVDDAGCGSEARDLHIIPGMAWQGPSVAKNHEACTERWIDASTATPGPTSSLAAPAPHHTLHSGSANLLCRIEDQRLDQRISSQRNDLLTPAPRSPPLSDHGAFDGFRSFWHDNEVFSRSGDSGNSPPAWRIFCQFSQRNSSTVSGNNSFRASKTLQNSQTCLPVAETPMQSLKVAMERLDTIKMLQ